MNFLRPLTLLEKNMNSKSLYLRSFPSITLFFLPNAPARSYLPELQRARAARDASLQATKEDSMNRFMKDLTLDRAQNPDAALHDRWDPDQIEEGDDDDDDGDVNIIDRSTFCLCGLFPLQSRKTFSHCLLFRGGHIVDAATSYLVHQTNSVLLQNVAGEDPWPGQYVDVTRARRHEDERINWPRPG